jgi:signal transduction histidine kinase
VSDINKISLKLGILFLIVILLVESISFIFLYYGLLQNRVEDETNALLARGHSHRDVLEKHFEDEATLEHVALMESEAETMVVITDLNKNILVNSEPVNKTMMELIYKNNDRITGQGKLIEDRWRTMPYLATVSPIYVDNTIQGYVYMFVNTESIRKVSERLSFQFIVIGGLSVLLTIVTVFFLTRFITVPLISMKKATEKIITGNHTVSLDVHRKDELGELAGSIQMLSNDLNRLKKNRTDFLASIAHELRTPLTYLKGYATIAQRPITNSEDRFHYLAIIKEESDHLTKLVEDLFDLAKLDQHSFIIHKEKVNLTWLLHRVIKKVRPAFSEKGIRVVIEAAGDIPVCVDAERFSQVILNLLDNSLHYTDSGKQIIIKIKSDNNDVFIEIEDQGEGIPEEELPFIWDRLYRVDKSRSRKYGGSGLGLSIAKEIIEKHGGTIEAKSKVGYGTTMTICLKRGV